MFGVGFMFGGDVCDFLSVQRFVNVFPGTERRLF